MLVKLERWIKDVTRHTLVKFEMTHYFYEIFLLKSSNVSFKSHLNKTSYRIIAALVKYLIWL